MTRLAISPSHCAAEDTHTPSLSASGFEPPLSSWAACVMIDLRDCRRPRRSLRVSG